MFPVVEILSYMISNEKPEQASPIIVKLATYVFAVRSRLPLPATCCLPKFTWRAQDNGISFSSLPVKYKRNGDGCLVSTCPSLLHFSFFLTWPPGGGGCYTSVQPAPITLDLASPYRYTWNPFGPGCHTWIHLPIGGGQRGRRREQYYLSTLAIQSMYATVPSSQTPPDASSRLSNAWRSRTR